MHPLYNIQQACIETKENGTTCNPVSFSTLDKQIYTQLRALHETSHKGWLLLNTILLIHFGMTLSVGAGKKT